MNFALKCELCGWAVPIPCVDPLVTMLAHKQEQHGDKDPRDIAFVAGVR